MARRKQRFRLYVAGNSLNSAQALKNLRALCGQRLDRRHETELVDVLRHPERALEDRVLVTPTLLRLGPGKEVKIFGNLNNPAEVLAALRLETEAP